MDTSTDMQIDDGKTRLSTQTQIDSPQEQLINIVSSSIFAIWFFIIIALYNQLYFVAFSYFVFILSFKIQKQFFITKRRHELFQELNLVSNDIQSNKYSVRLGTLVKKHHGDNHINDSFNWLKKKLGSQHNDDKYIESQIVNSSKSNAICPILINDEMLREHCALVASSGGGKTVLLCNSYIEYSVAKGAGCFAVFGKADNEALQSVQAICAKYNRLSDLVVYDFSEDKFGKTNSNSINMFDLGNARSIITALVSIGKFPEKDGGWGASAKNYLSTFLRIILTLRDGDFFVDVSKIEKIYDSKNKFEEYQKHLKKLDYFGFSKLISDIELLIKFLIIFDEMYETNKSHVNEKLYKKFTDIINSENIKNTSTAHLSNAEQNQFHDELKSVVINLCEVPNWNSLQTIFVNGVETEDGLIFGLKALSLVYPVKNGVFYELDKAISGQKNIFEFFNAFASILKCQHNDLSIMNAIDSQKVVIVNLPGQNPTYTPILAELIISILSLLMERKGKDYKADNTSLILLDEINSWLKTSQDESYNLGNILSVCRGLGFGAVLSFQSSLKETLGSVDASQVFASTKTIIALKLEDEDLIEKINKKTSKVQKLELTEHLHSQKFDKNKTNEDSAFTKSEEDYFKPTMLSTIKKGEGYIVRNSNAHKFVANYINQENMYHMDKDEIMLQRYISEEQLKKELL